MLLVSIIRGDVFGEYHSWWFVLGHF